MKKDFPKKSRNDFNNDINNLVIRMIEVDSIEVNNVQISTKNAGMLGDTGVQSHVAPPS